MTLCTYCQIAFQRDYINIQPQEWRGRVTNLIAPLKTLGHYIIVFSQPHFPGRDMSDGDKQDGEQQSGEGG